MTTIQAPRGGAIFSMTSMIFLVHWRGNVELPVGLMESIGLTEPISLSEPIGQLGSLLIYEHSHPQWRMSAVVHVHNTTIIPFMHNHTFRAWLIFSP